MDNKRTNEEKISESRLVTLLAEITDKLDRLQWIDDKIESIQDDIKNINKELDNMNVKVNNLENRIIRGNPKEDIKIGLSEIRHYMDCNQIKIRNSVKLVSDKVTKLLEIHE
ncbi:MAG: hypothetical protein ACLTUN_07240 [Paraclostridium sordellii]